MLKQICFAVIILILPTLVLSQKTKDVMVKVPYTRLPDKLIDPEFKTYSTVIRGYDGNRYGEKSKTELAEYFTLDGYRKLPSGGHMRVVYSQSYLQVGQRQANTDKKTTKDKEGKEKTTYSYSYNYPLACHCEYSVIDMDGDIMLSKGLKYDENIKSKTYSSSSARYKDATNSYKNALRTAARSMYSKCRSEAMKHIRTSVDFWKTSEREYFHYLKKADEEKESKEKVERIKILFDSLKATNMPSEVKAEFNDHRLYFEELADKYYDLGLTKKKYMKIAYDMLRNSYQLSYYLGDIDAANEYANRMIETDVREVYAKKLVSKVQKLEQDFDKHNVKSLYFKRDFENAVGPEKVKELEAEKKQEEAENDRFDGFTVSHSNDTLKGYFLLPVGSSDVKFGSNSNLTFRVEGEEGDHEFNWDSTATVVISDEYFQAIDGKRYKSGKEVSGRCFVERVFDSEKIKLFKYIESDEVGDSDFNEYAYQKGSDEIISLLSTQFLLLNKGLAKYFADCPDLEEMSASGTFKLNEQDLIKAARIYSELCD